jgi:Uma2 family endonuclease
MSTTLQIPTQPRILVFESDPPLSDEEFENLCLANDLFQLERTKDGKIEVNPPAAGFTSDGNAEIIYQLRVWWNQHERGRVFDSSAGFFLPDGSMLSPDTAYITRQKSRKITDQEGRHFLRKVPDFVVELLSGSDSFSKTKRKMESWIRNGVALGWLVDPYKKQVLIYEPGKEVRVETGTVVKGMGPVEGFTLNLKKVWRRYEPEQ